MWNTTTIHHSIYELGLERGYHKPTGTVSQVLLTDRSILDDWSYDRVMLQLLGTAGTVEV